MMATTETVKPETISATKLRIKTRDLMEQVRYEGARYIVETFGRPMIVLISYEDFLRVQDLLNEAFSTNAPKHSTLVSINGKHQHKLRKKKSR